jgi:DNA-binding protein H-NS
MPKLELDTMELDELEQLKQDVESAIGASKARRKREALAAIQAQAKEYGFELSELVENVKQTKSARTPAAPKFRHPENPSLTWSGRGRKPAWFTEALGQGMKQEDLWIYPSRWQRSAQLTLKRYPRGRRRLL